ncbi:DUF4870 domain-containing protein [bacterium]|nr:DUF4870 domain-containing protein [bacterium]
MVTRAIPSEAELTSVRWEERPWLAMLHALGWIPIWGFILGTLFWLFFRQRSRQAIFHIQQVIQFQILLLLPMLGWCVLTILARVLGGILPMLGSALQRGLDFSAIAVLTMAAVLGLWAACEVYMGRRWLYPLFGQRVLQASIRKLTEE